MLYFYGLSLALQFDRPTYGMERPEMFLPLSVMFLVAIALEAILAWWDRRVLVLWSAAWLAAYGFIWLYMAPKVFGDHIIPYVLLVPLGLVFFGGFAFAYARIFSTAFFPRHVLTLAEVELSLGTLPGWKAAAPFLEKTYRFKDFGQALNFMNQVARASKRGLLCSRVRVAYDEVSVQLYDWELRAYPRASCNWHAGWTP
jgi:pterin-4a-carbinolamine dehydratase